MRRHSLLFIRISEFLKQFSVLVNQGFYELPTTNCELPSNRRLKGKRFPFVGLVLAAMVGILAEEIFQWSSCWLMLGLIIAFGGWCVLRRWRQLFLFSFVILSFGIVHAWQWGEAPARRLASLINEGTSNVLAKGIVTSEVKRVGKNHLSFLMEVKQLEWNATTLTPNVTMLIHWEGPMPAYGDLLSLRAAAESPSLPKNPGEFNKTAWLARQEISTELRMDPSEPGTILSSGHGFFLKRWAIQWREHSEKLLESGIQDDAAVVNIIKGIVLGLKENEALLDDFKLTGTMHLFAVSGLHVGMVVMMIWFFLKLLRLSPVAAVPVTLLFLFFYVMMTGCRIGSLRAAIMAAVVLGGLCLGRRPQVLNSLAAAAFFLLLFETNLLFSMGWQFSFSVVLAIVLLTPLPERYFKKYFEYDPFLPKSLITPWQKRWQHFGKHVAQLVAVSIAAWVGALLPTAYYFHQISFSALGANVLAVPLTFLIMLTALLAIGTGLITASGAIIFNNANWLFVKILLCVIHGFALLPWSSYSIALPAPLHPRLTLFAFPDGQAALLQTEGKNWLINTGRALNVTKTIRPFLEVSGIKQLDGIFLTNEDPAFAGGASLLATQFPKATLVAPSDHGRSYLFQRLIKTYRATHGDVTSLQQRGHIDFSSALIFHHSRDEEAAKADEVRQAQNCDDGCMRTYCPRSNSSLTQHSSVFPASAVERGEISGLCWGEIFETPNSDSLALKLHLGRTTVLMISDAVLAQWLLAHVESEMLRADILNLPWKNFELLQQEALLATIGPRMLILPDHFSGQQKILRDEEKQLLQQHGVTLFSQDETGAISIDAFPGEARVSGFLKQTLTFHE